MTRHSALLLVSLVALQAQAQAPADSSLRLDIGWGVDTLGTPNRTIFRLWKAYLADRPDSVRPNPYWSEAEQAEWPEVDLLAP